MNIGTDRLMQILIHVAAGACVGVAFFLLAHAIVELTK